MKIIVKFEDSFTAEVELVNTGEGRWKVGCPLTNMYGYGSTVKQAVDSFRSCLETQTPETNNQ